ncbi:MAG: CAP domain-containing protein [Deinococcales bacterium]
MAQTINSSGLLRLAENLAQDPLENALLELTNQERSRNGVVILKYDENLAIAARNHAKEMAELGYLSHESPIPEHQSLRKRVLRAGSAVQNIAENIAQLTPQGDIVEKTINGWMNSPSHRENLLEPSYTHIGFGLAHSDGYVYIVQVFAQEPMVLQSARASEKITEFYQAEVDFNLKERIDAVVFYGEDQSPLQTLDRGKHSVKFSLGNKKLIQVRLGTRNLDATDRGFILQDEGWLDVNNDAWRPGNITARNYGNINTVKASLVRARSYRLELLFESAPDQDYAVWINGKFITGSRFEGNWLILDIPDNAESTLVELGVNKGDNRYGVSIRLELHPTASGVTIAPAPLKE